MFSEDQVEKIKAALTPDHHSKSAYIGRIKQTVTTTVFTEDGTPIQKTESVFITWETLELIMNMIRKRAGI